MEKGLKILGLEVDQIRRLKIARIAIDPKTDAPIFVTGQNEQGKSTALDSFIWALSGGRLPEDMIRRGEEGGEIRIALGDSTGPAMTVRKVFKAGQDARLIVKSTDGMTGNQATLAAIVGAIGLDPVALANMRGDAQGYAVRKALGLSFTDLDNETALVYQGRADLNRTIRDDEALLRSFQIPDGTPDQEVDVAALAADLENVRDMIQANEQARTEVGNQWAILNRDQDSLGSFSDRVSEITRKIDDLNRQIVALEQSREAEYKKAEAFAAELESRQKVIEAREAEVKGLVDPDPEPIRVQIQAANGTNEAVRAKKAKTNLEKKIAGAKERADAMTARLEAIANAKQARIQTAGLPPGLEGIGFDTGKGLVFEGFALSELSTGTRLRVATQIVLLLNQKRTGRPLNVVLIKAGNDLDDANRKIIVDTATAAGAQVWIEMIRKPESGEGLVVEVADGEAFSGVDPAQAKADAAPVVEQASKPAKEAAPGVVQAPKDPALDDELAKAQERLAAKKKARKSNLAPDVQGVVREAMTAAGRGSELFK